MHSPYGRLEKRRSAWLPRLFSLPADSLFHARSLAAIRPASDIVFSDEFGDLALKLIHHFLHAAAFEILIALFAARLPIVHYHGEQIVPDEGGAVIELIVHRGGIKHDAVQRIGHSVLGQLNLLDDDFPILGLEPTAQSDRP